MRTIALEEHIIFPEFVAEIPTDIKAAKSGSQSPMIEKLMPLLEDIGDRRLKSMDDNGISLQILSVVGAGADLLDPDKGPAFASRYNDSLAERIKPYPNRFGAFAHLPLTNPTAAASELHRTVKTFGFKGALINGLTNDLFLDNAVFQPLLTEAEALGVPIYLHPGLPPKSVADAYYSDLPNNAGQALGVAGWGWHSETALHILRLIYSGSFDKYPKLKIIIGHMGEMLPTMMERNDSLFKVGSIGINKRSVKQTLRDQVFITTSGIFTQPPLQVAIDTFGIDNILFSVDYPFSKNEEGRGFLENLHLSVEGKSKISYLNAERVLS